MTPAQGYASGFLGRRRKVERTPESGRPLGGQVANPPRMRQLDDAKKMLGAKKDSHAASGGGLAGTAPRANQAEDQQRTNRGDAG